MAGSVEFHTGVPDTLAFACRLMRKAYRRGFTVLCLVPPDRLEALDRQLWTFAERDFVPHVRLDSAASRHAARTPIWLATALLTPTPAQAARDVVLSLGGTTPVTAMGEGDTPRLIELVGADAQEVERGRALWRQYKAAGREVVHHAFGAVADD